MSFGGFLTPQEIQIIKSDFENILRAPEATLVALKHKLPSSVLADDAFGVIDAGEGIITTTSASCLQEIILVQKHGTRFEGILSFGILTFGDCVFYFSKNTDLELGDYESLRIVAEEVEWKPIPKKFKAFYNYLSTRLGNDQVGQVVPCTVKK